LDAARLFLGNGPDGALVLAFCKSDTFFSSMAFFPLDHLSLTGRSQGGKNKKQPSGNGCFFQLLSVDVGK
jgi:hypothetical protein